MHRACNPRAARRLIACAPILILILSTAHAQSGRTTQRTGAPPQPTPQGPRTGARSNTLRVELPTPVAETPVPLLGGGAPSLSFVTPDANFERNLVKDAPFTAESVTEHVQTLADGNRMGRKTTARLFRDGAGRTRREHTLTRGGSTALAPDGEPPRLIIINDPVGQVGYTIETQTNVARRQALPPGLMAARARALGGNAPFSVLIPTSTAHRRMAEGDSAPPPPEPQRERLEPQLIEGVMAEGTRTTLTVPAGEFDNEQPLVITHEEWYAPDLHIIVLMKHNDPRFGETTFRLTNITRGEPAPELFQAPQGYQIVDAGPVLRPGPRGDVPATRRPGVIKN
ncbi:MAG TPA: hypothetical protein VF546_08140 [Pyrinomonadaceae bacterium]|jgi:hypothetical protein